MKLDTWEKALIGVVLTLLAVAGVSIAIAFEAGNGPAAVKSFVGGIVGGSIFGWLIIAAYK